MSLDQGLDPRLVEKVVHGALGSLLGLCIAEFMSGEVDSVCQQLITSSKGFRHSIVLGLFFFFSLY